MRIGEQFKFRLTPPLLAGRELGLVAPMSTRLPLPARFEFALPPPSVDCNVAIVESKFKQRQHFARC